MFSENRSAPMKTGHFAQDMDKTLGPGQYDLNTFVDLMNKQDHSKQGKFGKLAQYPVSSGDRVSLIAVPLQPRNPNW